MITAEDFPKHLGELCLTHNGHKSCYDSIEEWEQVAEVRQSSWVSPEERARAIEADSVWELQWYPRTPIGFNLLLASDLGVVLRAALALEKEGERT